MGPDGTHTAQLEREVSERLEEFRPLISSHAGGLELVEVTSTGTVRLRFTGMCTGCLYRPVTIGGLKPALLGVAGVTAVETEGSRISAEAEERLARYLAG
jgi:Fe-S cluster biogenesis protein NfuA